MRKAINENPVVQAALIGVLALAVGLMLIMQMGGSSSEDSATTDAATEAVAAGAPTTDDPAATAASGTDPAAAAGTATPAPATGAAPAVTPGGTASGEFTAGPGLPKAVVDAYDDDKAVVLLVVNRNGIDDRELERMVDQIKSHPGATVFVVDVKNIADYSRITEGVDLDRTPAMVVIRPKRLDDAPMPTAVISYGFRGGASVEQALVDALYKGPSDLPYYPK